MNAGTSKLSFTMWTLWDDRPTLSTPSPSGGVYLLAFFNSDPPAKLPDPDRLPFEVIYVGDAKNLNRRPLLGRHHKVGERLRKLFGDDVSEHLYVAVGSLYTIDPKPIEYASQRTYSVYMESKLAWDYAQLHNHPPILQVKDTPMNEPWISEVVSRLQSSFQSATGLTTHS